MSKPISLYSYCGSGICIEQDHEKDELPAHMTCVSEAEIRKVQSSAGSNNFIFLFFYCPSLFFTFVFVSIFCLVWVSSLAYPNLLGLKGLVIVVSCVCAKVSESCMQLGYLLPLTCFYPIYSYAW
jgi:hypothetical protein